MRNLSLFTSLHPNRGRDNRHIEKDLANLVVCGKRCEHVQTKEVDPIQRSRTAQAADSFVAGAWTGQFDQTVFDHAGTVIFRPGPGSRESAAARADG